MLIRLEQFIDRVCTNKWYVYFVVFCRISLAIAYGISGWVKISGERFAAGLPSNHPLGHYFDALLDTGFYYTFIGIGQVFVALLLLIPRTALLGAIMSLPIVLNIVVLTYSVRFEGTRIVTFMLLANVFLLVWDYRRLKYILPLMQVKDGANAYSDKSAGHPFPWIFFSFVMAILASVIWINQIVFDIRPGNSPEECWNSCRGSDTPKACQDFCDCIYNKGNNMAICVEKFEIAKEIELKAHGKNKP